MTDVKDTAAHFVAAFNSHDERALNALHADNIKFCLLYTSPSPRDS